MLDCIKEFTKVSFHFQSEFGNISDTQLIEQLTLCSQDKFRFSD